MPTEVEQPKQVLNTLSPKQEIQPVQPIQDTQPSIQAQQNPVVDVKSPQPKKPTLVVTNKPLPDVSPIESAKEVKPVVLEGPSVVQVEVTE